MKTLVKIGLIILSLVSLSCVNPAGSDLGSYAGKWYGDYFKATAPTAPIEMELSIDVDGETISGSGYFVSLMNPTTRYSISGTISDTGFLAECTNDKINPGHIIKVTIEGTFTDNTSALGTYITRIDGEKVDEGTFSITKADSGT